MTKIKTQYVCQSCGSTQLKWMGRCPDCDEWNTLVETLVETRKKNGQPLVGSALHSKPQRLTDIAADNYQRTLLPMNEFNRVLGGGLVPGSLVLIGGDPGIGKSTLLLQISVALAGDGPVLYISGEESPQQIKLRASRLGIAADSQGKWDLFNRFFHIGGSNTTNQI